MSSYGKAWVTARAGVGGRGAGGGSRMPVVRLCLVPCLDSPSRLGLAPPPASAGCQLCQGVVQGQGLWGSPEQVAG